MIARSTTTPLERYAVERDRAERALESVRASIKAHADRVASWDSVAEMRQTAELLELTSRELEVLR